MNKKMAALFAVLALAGWGPVRAEEDHGHHAASGQGIALQGEVLDMVCYMAHEGKGAKHAQCAQSCIDGGAPAGLLTKEGAVYLLLEDHSNKKPYEAAKKMAGKQVKVTGKAYTRGGVQALVLASAESVK